MYSMQNRGRFRVVSRRKWMNSCWKASSPLLCISLECYPHCSFLSRLLSDPKSPQVYAPRSGSWPLAGKSCGGRLLGQLPRPRTPFGGGHPRITSASLPHRGCRRRSNGPVRFPRDADLGSGWLPPGVIRPATVMANGARHLGGGGLKARNHLVITTDDSQTRGFEDG